MPEKKRFRPFSLFQNKSKSREAEIARISALLKKISIRYFGELIQLQADLLIQKDSFLQSEQRKAPSKEDYLIQAEQPEASSEEQYLGSLNGDYFNLLNYGIFRYMKEGQPPSSTDGSQARALSDTAAAEELAKYFYERAKRLFLSFDEFIEILDALFTSTEEKFNRNGERLKNKKISSCIARVIQDIVIGTPQRISNDYNGLRVSKTVEKCLIGILKYIEFIRKNYIQEQVRDKPDTSLRTFNKAVEELRLQIGLTRADSSVRLSLREVPVDLPLVGDKLDLYAREKADSDSLAYRIVISNGAILVTGYEDVGKSTFVNLVLSSLPEVQRQHPDTDSWQVFPIEVNLTEATSFFDVLQLCIRALHPVLTEATQQGITKLSQDEKVLLDRAHLRAQYKYSERGTESEGTSTQIAAGIKSPDKLGTVPVPFSLTLQGGKDWEKKVEYFTELREYDEGQAKRDIEKLTNWLARPRSTTKGKVKIKPAFIFDGIDQMDNKEKTPLLRQLLNLSTSTSYAVFLFVISYDLWPTELGRPLSFAVPLFTTKETARYLKRVTLLPPEQKLKSEEEMFIQRFAGYLTYHAQGIPRRIILTLGDKVEPDLAYITIPPKDKRLFHVYALLQQALENLMTSLDPAETAFGESKYSREQRDHIQKGLYELVEELLNQGSLDLVSLGPEGNVPNGRSNSPPLENIFATYFKRILQPPDFNRLVDELAHSLRDIEIERNKIFSLKKPSQYQILTVLETFYELTGRRAAQSTSAKAEKTALDQIEQRLNEKERLARRLALNDIEQYWKEHGERPDSSAIATHLYRIFLIQSEEFRSEAARYLSGSAFFENVKRDVQPLQMFIEQETDQQLLRDFIRLIDEGANDPKNRQDGTELLLELLSRHLRLSPPIMIAAISLLEEICEKDVLEQVVKSLDPRQDINAGLLSPLIALGKKSKQNLISLLFTHNFTAISIETLKTLLSEQDDAQMKGLWSLVSDNKSRKDKFAQQIMVAILQRLPEVDPAKLKNLGGAVLEWLNSPDDWDPAVDQAIPTMAVYGNPRLHSILEMLAKQLDKEVARERLDAIFHPPYYTPISPSSQGNWGIVGATVFAALVLALIYFAIPFDLPIHATLASRLTARFLEAIYVNGGLLGLLLVGIFVGIIPSSSVERRRTWFIFAITFIAIAVICFFIQIYTHSLVYTFLGQSILLILAASIFWLPFGVWIATREKSEEKRRSLTE